MVNPGSILETKIPLVVLTWDDLVDVDDVSDYAILPVGARVFVVETIETTLKVMAHDQVWYCDVGEGHSAFDATFDIVYEATDAL